MRLIDADELFKWYTGQRTKYPVGKGAEQYSTLMMYEILDEIDNAPTIDPVRHGRWICVGFMEVECSECSETFHELESTNYCPSCGAKMDEVSE